MKEGSASQLDLFLDSQSRQRIVFKSTATVQGSLELNFLENFSLFSRKQIVIVTGWLGLLSINHDIVMGIHVALEFLQPAGTYSWLERHPVELWRKKISSSRINSRIVRSRIVTSNLLAAVARHIPGRLKIKLTDFRIAKRPKPFQSSRAITPSTRIRGTPVRLVRRVPIKEAGMKMRTPIFGSVLTAHIKTDTPGGLHALSKAFHKALKMLVHQLPADGKVRIVVSEGDKAIVWIERSLVDTPQGPLPGALQTTAYALPAWEIERSHRVVLPPLDEDDGPVQALKRLDRMEARHQRRQPPRMGACATFGAFVR